MEYKLENFILEIDNFLDESYCNHVIEYYEQLRKAGFGANRVQLEKQKRHILDDTNIGLAQDGVINLIEMQDVTLHFLDKFWEIYYEYYADKYSVLHETDKHYIRQLKLQKSEIGQAFHRWHFETYSQNSFRRILTFIAYLNDVEDGGETEFLYYPKRVKSSMGKLILFPGSFTHTHRGNPPLSNEKYILTGWVEF